MSTVHIEESRIIDARAEDIYAVFADYAGAHNDVLPKEYFKRMAVVEGGHGAGTIIDVAMEIMGKKLDYHMIVTEPEPGRMLAETDEANGVYTMFTIDPVEGGQRTRVTIASDMRLSGGLTGMLERMMTPSITGRIYRQELEQLAAYMHERAGRIVYQQA